MSFLLRLVFTASLVAKSFANLDFFISVHTDGSIDNCNGSGDRESLLQWTTNAVNAIASAGSYNIAFGTEQANRRELEHNARELSLCTEAYCSDYPAVCHHAGKTYYPLSIDRHEVPCGS